MLTLAYKIVLFLRDKRNTCLNVFALEANNANYSLFGNKFKKNPLRTQGHSGTRNPEPQSMDYELAGAGTEHQEAQGQTLAEDEQGFTKGRPHEGRPARRA